MKRIIAPDAPEAVGLAVVVEALRRRRPAVGCFIIGVTGAVAVGKSTFSAALQGALEAWPERPIVERVSSDGFLHANAVLDRLGLTARKGFPESYDVGALRAALAGVRTAPAVFPSYSHTTYDVDAGLARTIAAPDILIIEGLSLNADPATDGPVAGLLDALIYLDADEADIEGWFVDRFLGFWAAAEHDPASFYARFRQLDRDQAAQMAGVVWAQINRPNLRQYIAPARAAADIIVHKAADHRIAAVTTSAAQ
jgi:type I pantothenate kinase